MEGKDAIFCGNFCSYRDGWPPCAMAWHASCYSCLGQGAFPMRRVVDEDGNPWHNDAERIKDLNEGVGSVH